MHVLPAWSWSATLSARSAGVDDLRFIQPVNHGDSIRVRLACKQKTLRGDSGYGEVRWDAEVTNQDDEVCAQYDVLTMVATNAHWASVQ